MPDGTLIRIGDFYVPVKSLEGKENAIALAVICGVWLLWWMGSRVSKRLMRARKDGKK